MTDNTMTPRDMALALVQAIDRITASSSISSETIRTQQDTIEELQKAMLKVEESQSSREINPTQLQARIQDFASKRIKRVLDKSEWVAKLDKDFTLSATMKLNYETYYETLKFLQRQFESLQDPTTEEHIEFAMNCVENVTRVGCPKTRYNRLRMNQLEQQIDEMEMRVLILELEASRHKVEVRRIKTLKRVFDQFAADNEE